MQTMTAKEQQTSEWKCCFMDDGTIELLESGRMVTIFNAVSEMLAWCKKKRNYTSYRRCNK